ncbi:MAG: flavin reductase family protein [Verrucomicrobia bacterium]|nr:flavin reductase family protein [Verrucomicrobiota bacterium]
MIYKAEDLSPKRAYEILETVVVPRPIAFITTVSPEGIVRATPHSFFTVVNEDPPMVAFSAGTRELGKICTVLNIETSNEFVVNVVTEELLNDVVAASGHHTSEVSELEMTRLKTVKSSAVHPPRIAASPVSLECRLWRQIPLSKLTQKGGNVLTIGKVVVIHVDDALLTRGKPDVTKFSPIGRLAGDWFVPITERLKRKHPRGVFRSHHG